MENEEKIIELIRADKKWHSWKCTCGCLNRRSNANCGMCYGIKTTSDIFYGSDDYVVDIELLKKTINQ